jgi:acetyl esterase/lipase
MRRFGFVFFGLVVCGAVAAAIAQPPAEAKKKAEAAKSAAAKAMAMLAERAEVHTNLAYVEKGHERQKLDVFVPKGEGGPYPLVVWIHGGGWQGGSKEGCPLLKYLMKKYVVASVNYRLSQHAIFPAQIEDCQEALRWLRKNAAKYKIDPDRIGVAGASAGGHLVALLGVSGAGTKDKPDRVDVQCVVNIFGPANFLTIWPQSDPKTTVIKHNELDSPEGRLFGGPIPEKEELAKKASPSLLVTKDAPPFLILHGKKDRLVPWQQSEELDAALKKAGVESTLMLSETAGHDGTLFAPPYDKAIDEFFAKHLEKPANAAAKK